MDDPARERRDRYKGSLDFASHSLKAVLNREEVDFLDLRFNILNVMENFMGRHQELLNLVSVKDKDLVTFVHLLHVSVLSMSFASKLGFAKDDVLDLGIAALFHDVGKLHISSEILKKDGKLADRRVRPHQGTSFSGFVILQGYQEALGILPAVVAFEHHLRFDGKGYPKVPYPRPPHAASLIVSLCDVYDALTQKRSYKTDYPPDKVYEIMSLEKGKLFDPALLERFFQVIGVWPIGAIVMLTDGRIAVVREVNEQDILQAQGGGRPSGRGGGGHRSPRDTGSAPGQGGPEPSGQRPGIPGTRLCGRVAAACRPAPLCSRPPLTSPRHLNTIPFGGPKKDGTSPRTVLRGGPE